MPLVGMIRSTRVFVPKSKDFGSNSLENKISRGRCRDDWFRFLEDSGERADDLCYKCKNLISRNVNLVQEHREENEFMMDLNEETVSSVESVNNSSTDGYGSKKYGIVFSRRRLKLTGERFVSSSSELETLITEDRMFGIPYDRKRKQRKESERSFLTELKSRARTSEIRKGEPELEREVSLKFDSDILVVEREVSLNETVLSFTVESSCGDICWFTYFLASVLSFMRRSSLKLSLLAAFMSSEPIFQVFSLHGIHFLRDPVSKITWKDNISSSGSCKILGTNKLVPLFFIDFLAIPLFFMGLLSRSALRSQYLPQCLVRYLKCLLAQAHGASHRKCGLSSIVNGVDISETKHFASGNTSVKTRNLNFITDLGESYGKNGLSVDSKSLWNVQRKRNSFRSARTNPLPLDLYPGTLRSDTDPFTVNDCHNSLCAPIHKQKRRKLLWNNPGNDMKELKSSLVELRQNMDLVCCIANILVIESDKCFREEGAKVLLEYSSAKEWVLAIKRQGFNRYIYKAHEWMKPSTTNRFTRAMIWAGENGWKLEFPDRREWLTFKELHRECIDRNVRRRPPPVSTIPVPSVLEVPDYESSKYVPFVQPDVYITMPVDEVTRVSMRKVANYDVDSGDEEWLGKLNNDLDGENMDIEVFSILEFEEMIDTLEKAAFYSPDDAFDENKAESLCPDSGRIFGPVYQYWLRKRKQKDSALLRVFQLQPQRKAKTQVLNKPVLRKRRSTKRQRQTVRGKQQSYLQALNAEKEQDDIGMVEEQNRTDEENVRRIQEGNIRRAEEANMRRIEEAKKSASKSTELAVLKRKHAQTLMDKADLASYWATMAVKIAEAAQVAESTEVATSIFLD